MHFFRIDFQGDIKELEGELNDDGKTVTIDGRTQPKKTNWYNICASKSAALEWYLQEKEKLVTSAKANLEEKERQFKAALAYAERELIAI